MSYAIREVFLTLQGEGSRAGSKSVFVRFAGCNLWDGRESTRQTGAGVCARWCDTDFFKGASMNVPGLLGRMTELWPAGGERWCVLTGGEPALQVDRELVDALHADGWKVAIETNGTKPTAALNACDHVCLSPKRGAHVGPVRADEVKVILPGAADGEEGWTANELAELERVWSACELFVQPQDPLSRSLLTRERSVATCLEWIMKHPRWKLSLQTHKFLGLP